jgi:hypothetical protein
MLVTICFRTFFVSHLVSNDIKVKLYRNIIMPVVLYGCEMWSVTSKEEHNVKVSKNRVLRKIFGLEGESKKTKKST